MTGALCSNTAACRVESGIDLGVDWLTLSFRVSEKGAVSVYGLGRFPVTLYQEQWDKLLAQIEDLRRFIDANRASLKKKEA